MPGGSGWHLVSTFLRVYVRVHRMLFTLAGGFAVTGALLLGWWLKALIGAVATLVGFGVLRWLSTQADEDGAP